jgi:hypothetical protein
MNLVQFIGIRLLLLGRLIWNIAYFGLRPRNEMPNLLTKLGEAQPRSDLSYLHVFQYFLIPRTETLVAKSELR